ncbi:hypothetical protein CRUP_000614 [Coryphaenoides rupestris]|nr:hypothetical protein CRUP_000614 [Coryphaenoides rupestris]
MWRTSGRQDNMGAVLLLSVLLLAEPNRLHGQLSSADTSAFGPILRLKHIPDAHPTAVALQFSRLNSS